MSRGRPDRGPRSLEISLDTVSSQLGLGSSAGIGQLFTRWDDIVGSPIAAHVQPIRIDEESLVVTVDHPAWATQIRHLGDGLLDRIVELTDCPRPLRLDVRVRQ